MTDINSVNSSSRSVMWDLAKLGGAGLAAFGVYQAVVAASALSVTQRVLPKMGVLRDYMGWMVTPASLSGATFGLTVLGVERYGKGKQTAALEAVQKTLEEKESRLDSLAKEHADVQSQLADRNTEGVALVKKAMGKELREALGRIAILEEEAKAKVGKPLTFAQLGELLIIATQEFTRAAVNHRKAEIERVTAALEKNLDAQKRDLASGGKVVRRISRVKRG